MKTKIYIPNCRKFTGYRPCEPYKDCLKCKHEYPFGTRILIINLDHLGDVIMTTAQLPAIKRKYPQSHLSWLTLKAAKPLLENNPDLDRVYEWNDENRMILMTMTFDLVMNADKNINSSAFSMNLNAKQKLGFGLNENGAIIPLNEAALYNYRMGLDDNLKFKQNQKTGQEILAETFELDYRRDPYILNLSNEEQQFCDKYRKKYNLDDAELVVGFNTGCSPDFPNKKMTIKQHVELINRLLNFSDKIKILLLGGKAETGLNREINRRVGERVIETPTTMGVRRGLCFINLCDVVVTGDTSGLHMAIGLGKYVVAWFGMTPAAEVDLYDRGIKVISNVDCAPCWKSDCPDPICVKNLNLDLIYQAILNYQKNLMLRSNK